MSTPKGGYDAHTALVVVDVQNDFAHPDGSLYVRAGAGPSKR
jgi:nicotinamidase-related amidase